MYLTDLSRTVTGENMSWDIYLGRLVGPWSLVRFPGCRALCFVYLYFFAAICGVRAKDEKERNPHISTQPCP